MDKKHYEQEHDIMEDNLLEPSVQKKPRVKWIIGAVLAVVLTASATIAVISVVNKIKKKNDVEIKFAHASIQYATFEEMVQCTDVIVKAKYLKCEFERLHNIYYFSVTKIYHGEIYQKRIRVKEMRLHACVVDVHDASFSTGDVKYKKNQEYYLFLNDISNAYSEMDTYILPADGGIYPVSKPTESTMYGDPLLKHSKLSDEASLELLEDYIVSLVNTVSFRESIGLKFIHETDLKTVLHKSNYVFELTVVEDSGQKTLSGKNDRIYYNCVVEDVLLGPVSKRGDSIVVTFPPNKVKPGDRIVVALFKVDERLEDYHHYYCSSRNSIIPKNQKEAISKIISDLS